jgi:hypothetical protein
MEIIKWIVIILASIKLTDCVVWAYKRFILKQGGTTRITVKTSQYDRVLRASILSAGGTWYKGSIDLQNVDAIIKGEEDTVILEIHYSERTLVYTVKADYEKLVDAWEFELD